MLIRDQSVMSVTQVGRNGVETVSEKGVEGERRVWKAGDRTLIDDVRATGGAVGVCAAVLAAALDANCHDELRNRRTPRCRDERR